MNRITWVTVVLAAAATVTAACGSTGPSKSDFVAQGDALCIGARRQLDTLTAPSSATEIADYLGRSLTINRDMLKKLRSLRPPPGDESAVQTVLHDFEEILARARSAQATAATGDDTATDVAIKELGMSVEKAGVAARAYGFKSCGSAAAGSDAGGPSGPGPTPVSTSAAGSPSPGGPAAR